MTKFHQVGIPVPVVEANPVGDTASGNVAVGTVPVAAVVTPGGTPVETTAGVETGGTPKHTAMFRHFSYLLWSQLTKTS